MIPDRVWLTAAAATVPAVILDMASGFAQRRRIREGGGEPVEAIGQVSRLFLSLLLNALVLVALAYLYFRLWAGSGGTYLFSAVLWLLITIPGLLLSRAMDESQQRVMATRALSMLFKAAALAVALSYFIG
jgi:protein-S-isoprenylcysteine O-methyltransferase Ste14